MDNEDTRDYNLVSPLPTLSPSLNRNFLVVHIMNGFLISLFPLLPSSHYISIYTSFHRSLLNAFPLCRIHLLPLSALATNCRYLSLSHPQIFPINRNTGSHSQPLWGTRPHLYSVCVLASVCLSVRPVPSWQPPQLSVQADNCDNPLSAAWQLWISGIICILTPDSAA